MLVEHGDTVVGDQTRQQISSRQERHASGVHFVAGCQNDLIDFNDLRIVNSAERYGERAIRFDARGESGFGPDPD
jgi:hypothetical protein